MLEKPTRISRIVLLNAQKLSKKNKQIFHLCWSYLGLLSVWCKYAQHWVSICCDTSLLRENVCHLDTFAWIYNVYLWDENRVYVSASMIPNCKFILCISRLKVCFIRRTLQLERLICTLPKAARRKLEWKWNSASAISNENALSIGACRGHDKQLLPVAASSFIFFLTRTDTCGYHNSQMFGATANAKYFLMANVFRFAENIISRRCN